MVAESHSNNLLFCHTWLVRSAPLILGAYLCSSRAERDPTHSFTLEIDNTAPPICTNFQTAGFTTPGIWYLNHARNTKNPQKRLAAKNQSSFSMLRTPVQTCELEQVHTLRHGCCRSWPSWNALWDTSKGWWIGAITGRTCKLGAYLPLCTCELGDTTRVVTGDVSQVRIIIMS